MGKYDYSITFYTGGIDVSEWQDLPIDKRKAALKKNWYIRWSYRHPETLKLVKQPHIKAGVNRFTTMTERMDFMRTYKRGMIETFREGINPFADPETEKQDPDGCVNISESIKTAMNIKRMHMKPSSFVRFKSDIGKFTKYLSGHGNIVDITDVKKKTVTNYLNEALKTVSARSRNNYRASISNLWQCLENEGMVPVNFVKSIPMLKSVPQRNRTYTDGQVEELFAYMAANCPNLLLFVKFVSYNFLRPIEVCRLTPASFDLRSKTISVMVKQGVIKTKTIPDLLISELPEMDGQSGFVFGRTGLFQDWDVSEDRRRAVYTAKFSDIKKVFGLGDDYGIYSFRHYFSAKMYRSLRKDYPPFETKSRMMLITGHGSMKALEKYLRSIDAEISDDYSDLL